MKQEREWRTNSWRYAVHIGFFAGLIWGFLKIVEHALKLTRVVPGFLLEPFFRHPFLGTWIGYGLGLVSFIVFSIVASLLYRILLLKAKGPWPGIFYGVSWWLVLYVLLGPTIGLLPSPGRTDAYSMVTDCCLFLLWGMFIGYSQAVEFTDEQVREPADPVH